MIWSCTASSSSEIVCPRPAPPALSAARPKRRQPRAASPLRGEGAPRERGAGVERAQGGRGTRLRRTAREVTQGVCHATVRQSRSPVARARIRLRPRRRPPITPAAPPRPRRAACGAASGAALSSRGGLLTPSSPAAQPRAARGAGGSGGAEAAAAAAAAREADGRDLLDQAHPDFGRVARPGVDGRAGLVARYAVVDDDVAPLAVLEEAHRVDPCGVSD